MKIPEDLLVVMPGHSHPKDGVLSHAYSRPKDGVLSHAYAPDINVLDGLLHARRRCRT
jgi:hypothetical protein